MDAIPFGIWIVTAIVSAGFGFALVVRMLNTTLQLVASGLKLVVGRTRAGALGNSGPMALGWGDRGRNEIPVNADGMVG